MKTTTHPAQSERVQLLIRIARENPYWQFAAEDIQAMMKGRRALAGLKTEDRH